MGGLCYLRPAAERNHKLAVFLHDVVSVERLRTTGCRLNLSCFFTSSFPKSGLFNPPPCGVCQRAWPFCRYPLMFFFFLYFFFRSNAEFRNAFLRTIRQIIRESVRNLGIPPGPLCLGTRAHMTNAAELSRSLMSGSQHSYHVDRQKAGETTRYCK